MAGPPVHVYVFAPDAVSVVLEPSHIVEVPVMVTVGVVCTVTDTEDVLIQPVAVVVPVTV